MTIKLYLAGPMSGIPQFNFPAFEEAAVVLRRLGFEITSPAEMDKARNPEAYELARRSPDGKWQPDVTGGLTWAQILAGDIVIVSDQVDGVVLMPGWEKSSGARLETFVGLLRNKLFATYDPVDESVQFEDPDRIRGILRENMP